MSLRIVFADDHELLRRGLRTLLESEPGWKVVGEAANGRQAVEMASRLQPDVVILDISMPELNGIEAARQVHQLVPQAELLMLSVHDSVYMLREALNAGARGYVLKSDAGRHLIEAVHALSEHKQFFSSSLPVTGEAA